MEENVNYDNNHFCVIERSVRYQWIDSDWYWQILDQL